MPETDLDQFISDFSGLTESYWFYDNTVQLFYDPKDHVYLLMTPDGLKKQEGVTTICHIIDKSAALIPWSCKMMGQKLFLFFKQKTAYEILSRESYEQLINDAKSAHKEKLEEAGE